MTKPFKSTAYCIIYTYYAFCTERFLINYVIMLFYVPFTSFRTPNKLTLQHLQGRILVGKRAGSPKDKKGTNIKNMMRVELFC